MYGYVHHQQLRKHKKARQFIWTFHHGLSIKTWDLSIHLALHDSPGRVQSKIGK